MIALEVPKPPYEVTFDLDEKAVSVGHAGDVSWSVTLPSERAALELGASVVRGHSKPGDPTATRYRVAWEVVSYLLHRPEGAEMPVLEETVGKVSGKTVRRSIRWLKDQGVSIRYHARERIWALDRKWVVDVQRG